MKVYGYYAIVDSKVCWKRTYEKLQKMGITRSQHQCRVRIKNLRVKFLNMLKNQEQHYIDSYARNCPYWKIMLRIWTTPDQ
jgi:hypothetical protein